MKPNTSISDKLRIFRLTNKFSQTEIGDMMNISSSQYSKIENGKCQLNIHHIIALASNLGKDFTEMYKIIDEIKNNQENETLLDSEIKPTEMELPNLKFSLELALSLLSSFCIENGFIIHIQQNGDISMDKK